jgi:hypothetical protein
VGRLWGSWEALGGSLGTTQELERSVEPYRQYLTSSAYAGILSITVVHNFVTDFQALEKGMYPTIHWPNEPRWIKWLDKA